MSEPAAPRCYLCGATDSTVIAELQSRPEGETDFGIPCDAYARTIRKCGECGVYFSVHGYDVESWYEAKYHEATYRESMAERYEAIRSLPFDRSDNKHRVRRILESCCERGWVPSDTDVLDVGSGLAVFAGELQEHGLRCHCLDLDEAFIAHARDHVGVAGAYLCRLKDVDPLLRFRLIAFNKVLEHVTNPVHLVGGAAEHLARDGVVYIEVPDGDGALRHGVVEDREEFYIEHYTVFTKRSLEYLVRTAGFHVLTIGEIHEPSDKFTLWTLASA